ncbi:MAG TPA: hypothetical protein VFW96_01445 [Thermomicrobiales bacterium]|nr:hypothetical protein [Thermomicrobiales bacterium]
MKAAALDPRDFAPEEALGRILAHDIVADRRPVFHKGHPIGPDDLARLRAAAGDSLHVLELEPGDLPEGEAARRLADAVAGAGVAIKGPVEGRYNVVADARGVLRLDRATLQALNELDDISIFTLYDGQVARPGEVLAGVKVTPLVTREATIRAAEDLARGSAGVVAVHAFRPLRVGVVIREALSARERERVLRRLGEKIAWFGSELVDAAEAPDDPGAVADAFARQARAGARLILATGGNALDPLDAMLQALARVGARLEAFGAPAHPGSLFWLAYLAGPAGEVPLFGVASCGMFSKATSVDLLLPAVFAGERLDQRRIAALWEGGLLNKQMAFKFPPYDEAD